MSPTAEDNSNKPNSSANKIGDRLHETSSSGSTFPAVNRVDLLLNAIGVGASVPPVPISTTSPGQQAVSHSHSNSHQKHSHDQITHINNSTYHSQTASHTSQSSSSNKNISNYNNLSNSNLQSTMTPRSRHGLKYIHTATDRLPLGHQSSSPESYTHQKHRKSNSFNPGAHVEVYNHQGMSTDAGSEGGCDSMPDHHTNKHIAQRISEEATKLEDIHNRNPTNSKAHIQQPQDTPQGTKRKRIFNNRTRTGCITCRRRKKKCDEGKPTCDNCKRIATRCEGYTTLIKTRSATIIAPVIRPADRSATLPPPDCSRHQPSQPTVPQTTLPPSLPLSGPAPLPQSQLLRRDPQVLQTRSAPVLHMTLPQVSLFSSPPVPPQPPLPQRFSPSTEKERMLNGELFHAFTPELIKERERCHAACWRFNNAANPTLCISREEKLRLQMEIFRHSARTRGLQGNVWGSEIPNANLRKNHGLQDLEYQVNEEPWIEVPFLCDYGYNITLGPGVFIRFGCTIIDTCQVTIKARTRIGPNVNIYSGTHLLNPRTRNGTKGPEFGKPVIIEEDCWIAGNVTILPGVKIGAGATVGAGAVVTSDVPPHTVVAGNPAKVIKGIM